MKKDVTVLIESENISPDKTVDKTTKNFPAILYIKNDLYLISYKESAEGFEDTTTTLKFKDGRVELMRSGKVSSHMIFESARPFNGIYPTPYGDLKLMFRQVKIRETFFLTISSTLPVKKWQTNLNLIINQSSERT